MRDSNSPCPCLMRIAKALQPKAPATRSQLPCLLPPSSAIPVCTRTGVPLFHLTGNPFTATIAAPGTRPLVKVVAVHVLEQVHPLREENGDDRSEDKLATCR
jgi:hypothetical protein